MTRNKKNKKRLPKKMEIVAVATCSNVKDTSGNIRQSSHVEVTKRKIRTEAKKRAGNLQGLLESLYSSGISTRTYSRFVLPVNDT